MIITKGMQLYEIQIFYFFPPPKVGITPQISLKFQIPILSPT